MNSFNLRNRFPFILLIKRKNRVKFKENIIKMSVCCVLHNIAIKTALSLKFVKFIFTPPCKYKIENQEYKHCKDRYNYMIKSTISRIILLI